MPQADYDKEAQEIIINENEGFANGKISGAKQKQQFDVKLNSLKRRWEDEDAYSNTRDVASKGVIKRSKQTSPSNKRVKVNGDVPNGIHADLIDDNECSEECVQKLPVYAAARENSLADTSTNFSIRMICLFVSILQSAHYYYAIDALSRWLTSISALFQPQCLVHCYDHSRRKS